MTTETARATPEEQMAAFTSESFEDGIAAKGEPTAAETAAIAADAAAKEAAKTGKAEGVADTEADGGEDEDTGSETGTEPTAEEKAAAEAAKTAKDGKRNHVPADKRIKDLTAARYKAEGRAETAESRAERAEAELAALKSGKATLTEREDTSTGDLVPPDPSKFTYGELDPEYIAALTDYNVDKRLRARDARDEEARRTQAASAKQTELGTKTVALVEAGTALHDDFEEVVMQGAKDKTWELTATLGELILDSDFGPQIAYHLASNPNEAADVAKKSPAMQAAYFGRMEARFEGEASSQQAGVTANPPVKAPQAPPPPKVPRGNAGQFRVGPDTEDFAAFEKLARTGS